MPPKMKAKRVPKKAEPGTPNEVSITYIGHPRIETLPKVCLCCSDGVQFEIDPKIARMSFTIRTILDDFDKKSSKLDGGAGRAGLQGEAIPLSCVDSETFAKVIIWCEHENTSNPQPSDPVTPSPPASQAKREAQEIAGYGSCAIKRSDDLTPWDREFMETNKHLAYELVMAANYLDIKGLMDVVCKTLANNIKSCKSTAEIRARFNIRQGQSGISEEDEIASRKEMGWCKD